VKRVLGFIEKERNGRASKYCGPNDDHDCEVVRNAGAKGIDERIGLSVLQWHVVI
jgi:hypothetical protein